MAPEPDESLFENTKMTFGEHLEELRVALFKSLMGLGVGMLLGMLAANSVVRQIQGPLTSALETYYTKKAVKELGSEYDSIDKRFSDEVKDRELVHEYVYVEVNQLKRLSQQIEEAATTVKNKPSSDATKQTQGRSTDKKASSTKETKDSATDKKSSANSAKETKPAAAKKKLDEKADQTPPIDFLAFEPSAPTLPMAKLRIWTAVPSEVKSLNAYEPFMVWLKAATLCGAVIASPWIFYQIWNFVAAGLYPHEKHYVHVFLPFSLGLFLAGCSLAFFFVFEPVLNFLLSFNERMDIDPDPRINEWLSFVLILPLGFGISFQLPLVMLLVERLGIVTISTYLEKWRIAVLGIFVLSMVVTPADPISMLLLAIPLTILFMLGIAMCKWMPKRKSPYGEGYDP